jgi:hypothetical protein
MDPTALPEKRKYNRISSDTLKTAAGFASRERELQCGQPSCGSATISCSFFHCDDPPFIACLECDLCKAPWKVCSLCTKGTKKLDSHSLADHVRAFHPAFFKDKLRQRNSFVLGHGVPLQFIPSRLLSNPGAAPDLPSAHPVREVQTSSICKKLFDINGFEGPVVAEYNVYMYEWSDDFEPNTSLLKSNRGSVWVKTYTFAPPDKQRHRMAYTYPVVMGPKGISHEEVDFVVAQDLERLQSAEGVLAYSKKHGGLIRLCGAKVIVSLQDQPERRGENHLAGVAFLLHRRFGWSFPWPEFANVLKPSDSCRAIMLNTSVPWECPRSCPHCTNFAFHKNDPLLVYDTGLPVLGSTGPVQLDFAMLTEAVHLAHVSYVEGEWDLEDVTKWLKFHCICGETIDLILLHADKCKEFSDILSDPNSSADLKAAIPREKEQHPLLYVPWPVPSSWARGVHLHQHPDVPMHLLFL